MSWILSWQPLTTSGILFLGFSLWSLFFFGIGKKDWVFLSVGAFGTCLVFFSVFWVLFHAISFRRQIRKENDLQPTYFPSFERGEWENTGFELPYRRFTFLHFDYFLELPHIEKENRREGKRWKESICFWRRGSFPKIQRNFLLSDLFGFAEIQWKMVQEQEWKCVPRLEPSFAFFPPFSVSGEDRFHPQGTRRGDRADTRLYQPGDPVKNIHWKLFAKTRTPIVRIPETTQSEEKKILALFVPSQDDEWISEVTRGILSSGELGTDWTFFALGIERKATHLEDALSLLCETGHSSLLQKADDLLAPLLLELSRQSDSNHLFVFCSPEIVLLYPKWESFFSPFSRNITFMVGVETEIRCTKNHRLFLEQELLQHWRTERSLEGMNTFFIEREATNT